jgi:ABC-2 type transport system ATP-binding protein
MTAAITVRDLTKLFGKFPAMQHVSLDVGHGEIYGLLGSNGCGKSTLLRTLAGALRATSGQFMLRGTMGYVAQRFGLYEDLFVEENINFHASCHGLRGDKLASAVAEALNLFDLSAMRRRKTGELSYGWKHRLAIATAICHQPAILLMDEPTAGIDPVARAATWEILAKIARKGTAILLATHHLDEAERCHRIGYLQEGTLLTSSTPTELKARFLESDHREVTLSEALAAMVRESKAA